MGLCSSCCQSDDEKARHDEEYEPLDSQSLLRYGKPAARAAGYHWPGQHHSGGPMPAPAFKRLIASLELCSENDVHRREKIILKLSQTSYLTCEQLGNVLENVPIDEQVKIATILVRRITDPQNAYMALHHVTDETPRAKIRQMLENESRFRKQRGGRRDSFDDSSFGSYGSIGLDSSLLNSSSNDIDNSSYLLDASSLESDAATASAAAAVVVVVEKATHEQIQSIKASICTVGFDEEKLGAVRELPSSVGLTCQQLLQILDAFDFTDTKLKLCRDIVTREPYRLLDPENHACIVEAIPFQRDKEEIEKLFRALVHKRSRSNNSSNKINY